MRGSEDIGADRSVQLLENRQCKVARLPGHPGRAYKMIGRG